MTNATFDSNFSEHEHGSVAAAVQTYAASVAIIAVSTLIGLGAAPRWSAAPAAMIYLLAVLAAAALWGVGRGLLAGVAAALAYDFYFTQPVHTFQMNRTVDVITVAVLLIAALATSKLAARIGDHVRMAAGLAARNAMIAGFAGRLLSCNTEKDIAWAACAELHRLFHCNVIMVADLPEPRLIAAIPAAARLTPSDFAAATLAIDSGQATGRGTPRLQATEWFYHPVQSVDHVLAAVGLARDDGKPPVGEAQLMLVSALLDNVALALASHRRKHPAQRIVADPDTYRDLLEILQVRARWLAAKLPELARGDQQVSSGWLKAQAQ